MKQDGHMSDPYANEARADQAGSWVRKLRSKSRVSVLQQSTGTILFQLKLIVFHLTVESTFLSKSRRYMK